MKSPATFAFIMDPLERVNIHTDTSFAFMLEAHQRGHKVVYVPPNGIALRQADVWLHGQVVAVEDRAGAHYRVLETTALPATDCQAIFIRTDPPFDAAYLMSTWLLSFAERAGVRIINSPAGIRAANEKLYALEFPELCPKTLVSASRPALRDFVTALGGAAIAKPLHGHGGFGVVRLHNQDSNLNALLDMLTREGQDPILVQAYLPGGATGDKRLLLIDGALCGAVKRVPQAGDHRGNVHVGGRVEACTTDAQDAHIVATLGPALRRAGLYFVGLDVIDGKLIEVNVTSPTLVQELRRLTGVNVAGLLFDALK